MAFLIVGLAAVVKVPALLRFVGEGLDDLDAAEGLLEDVVELGHFFHGAAIGPLQRLGQPADGQAGQRGNDQRQQQQPPGNQRRQRQAGQHLQRLAHHAAEEAFHPRGHALHVVGEPAHQVRGPLVVEHGQIQPQRAAIEPFPQLEGGQLPQPRRQHAVEDREQVLQHRAQEQGRGDQDDRLERVLGQIAVEIGLQPHVGPLRPLLGLQPRLRGGQVGLQLRAALGRGGLQRLLLRLQRAAQLGFVAAGLDDLAVGPLLQRFPLEDHLDEGIDRADVSAPEDGHGQGAQQRADDRKPMSQGQPHHSSEVLH